MSEDDSENVMC